MSLGKILYILECKHVMPGPISAIELDCLNCNKVLPVVDVHVYEWKAVCNHRGCAFAKWAGLAMNLAGYYANDHAHKHPDHEAGIRYTPNPLAEKQRARL
jgi:hypothetical protein